MLCPLPAALTKPQALSAIDLGSNLTGGGSERCLHGFAAAFAESCSDGRLGDAVPHNFGRATRPDAPIPTQAQIAVLRRVLHRWVREILELAPPPKGIGSLDPVDLL